MEKTEGIHWGVVAWRGTNDLADIEFVELLSGDSTHALHQLCHIWAHASLSPTTEYTVRYGGHGFVDLRENDPRKTIPLSTSHRMNPRQQATASKARRALGLREDDRTACQEWCAAAGADHRTT